MPELILHTPEGDKQISFEGAPLLHELLLDQPDAPRLPCGGNGKCGKCAVLAQGSFSALPDAQGRVLSCQARVTGDAEVWLPRRKILTQIETRTQESACTFEPVPGEYGAAIDLGTTTIVLQLLRLSDSKPLATVSCENPQRLVAADVIGRIDAALKGKLPLLTNLVRDCIHVLEQEAFIRAGLPDRTADVRVIAGNTTMLYLFTGRSPKSLSAAPFEADCLFGLQEERDILPACAGAFVGADITCAVVSSQMTHRPETALLIDVGTNGEIVLWHNGTLRCCATAAGPAFEGSGISCGTGSIPGAIDSVCVQDGKLAFTTLENAPACGVCGSGLIDLVAALLETEQLDETGFLEDDIELAEKVVLTQQDIRQVQLAKGAIAAGIRTLLQEASIEVKDVEVLYIAGGFGSHLNLTSAARIGLIPAELIPKTQVLGNASLGGARQLLLSRGCEREAVDIAQNALCLNAAACAGFSDAFVECMMFDE